MRLYLLLLTAACLAADEVPAPPDAGEIMKQVAANQDRAQKDRENYLYSEHIRVIIRRGSGRLAREESSDLTVTPGAKDTTRKVQSITGRYWKNGGYQSFSGEPIPEADSLDGSLAGSFRTDLLDDKSKDGMGKDLFPLTTDAQKDLRFELVDQEVVGGRPAYRIRFGPIDKHDFTWAGEALIDKEELQPVTVYTRLSRRLPLFVRAALGTDLPGLGFNVQYRRVDKDVWFPVSFGTEFRIHAVFFINRNVSVSMENKDFKKLTVDSRVQFGDAVSPPKQDAPH
jgi:hypothetical protein